MIWPKAGEQVSRQGEVEIITPASLLEPNNSLGCMDCECIQSYIWLFNPLFHPVITFSYLWVKSFFSCSVHLLCDSALKLILSLLMRSNENKNERPKDRESKKKLYIVKWTYKPVFRAESRSLLKENQLVEDWPRVTVGYLQSVTAELMSGLPKTNPVSRLWVSKRDL